MEAINRAPLAVCLFLVTFFTYCSTPEDEDLMFLLNVGKLLSYYTESHLSRLYSGFILCGVCPTGQSLSRRNMQSCSVKGKAFLE
jgi:hypothetical protein